MACLISHMRRLAVCSSRKFLSDANSHLASSFWKNEFKTSFVQPRILCLETYCTSSSSTTGQHSRPLERELNRQESKELEAEKILKNLSEDDRVKLEHLKTEYESWKAQLKTVPFQMRGQDWVELLKKETKSSRKKYYHYLAVTEFKILIDKQKKEQMRQAREERKAENSEQDQENRIIAKISLNKLRQKSGKVKAYQSMLYGNPFVFDFNVGFQKEREAKNLFIQLQACYSANKSHPEPFHMHFTGLPQTGPVAEEFKWAIPLPENVFVDYHTEDIHEVFPKDRLVYLTPNSRRYLEYDANDIYVIGALIDLFDHKPYTFAKAKRLNLRTACLPLDRFYLLKKAKSLPLDIVYRVMLTLNYTRDWEKAMLHVPTRFWAEVKTPKLKRYWEEKFEQQRLEKKRSQEEYDDSMDLHSGLENTESVDDIIDSGELNGRSRYKL